MATPEPLFPELEQLPSQLRILADSISDLANAIYLTANRVENRLATLKRKLPTGNSHGLTDNPTG